MFWKNVARCLMVTAGAALAVPIFDWSLNSLTLSQFIRQFVFSFIYANCIGIPLMLFMPPIWLRSCRWPALKMWISRALLVLLADFFGSLLADFIVWEINGRTYPYWADFKGAFTMAVVLSLIITAFVTMYEVQKSKLHHTTVQLQAKELERERALKLATESRLSSLESRIHPHFLFNTINSVSSLIHEDPRRAEKMLTQMAELLRFSLDSCQAGLVSLNQELRIVSDYLEIEKARFGDRLQYSIVAPDALLESRVPPLSLQTLVENSVKYAVSSRRQGATISSEIAAKDGRLILSVCDDGPGFSDLTLPSGHGLQNLQERLTVQFGDDATLQIHSTKSGSTVRVEMPLIGALFPVQPTSSHSPIHA